MGCGSSSLGSIPGFTHTPCLDYVENRRKTCKEFSAAHEGLVAASTAYGEALKAAGGSLKVFAATTHLGGKTAAPVLEAPPPPSLPAPDGTGSEEPTPDQMQLVAAPESDVKKELESITTRLDALYAEIAELLTQPLQKDLAFQGSLSKGALPALTASAAKNADGTWEPFGNSLQKLLNWEERLKTDVKTMESIRSEQKKKDKKLDKTSAKASRDPNADLNKVRKAQAKANDAASRLGTTMQQIGETYSHIEQFKLEVLFPQVTRVFPILEKFWAASKELTDQQVVIAGELAKLKLLQGGAPAGPAAEGSAEHKAITSASVDTVGTTKASHEATKSLEAQFEKLVAALGKLTQTQKQSCVALQNWVRATITTPGDLPKPPAPGPGAPPPLNAEASFAALANDWSRAVELFPEAKVKETTGAFGRSLKSAFEFQTNEMKQAKVVETAKKELAKAEGKLATAEKKEQELSVAADEIKDVAERAKEYEVRKTQFEKACQDTLAARAALEAAKTKVTMEKATLDRFLQDGNVALGAGLQAGLPELLRSYSEYAAPATRGYSSLSGTHNLSTKHAPVATAAATPALPSTTAAGA